MPKPYENPLTPNAQLRALYRAMVELRAIAFPKHLRKSPHHEAAYAASVLGLLPGDLTSSPLPTTLLNYLRAIPSRPGTGAPKASYSLSEATPFPGSESERLLLALGQAMALQAAGAMHCVVVHVSFVALKLANFRRALALAEAEKLPILFVTLPAILPRFPSPIPRIPVDGADPIAIYRVAQECLVRARAGGGPALLECVPPGPNATQVHLHDPVQVLHAQLLARRIATPRWLASVHLAPPAAKRKGTLG